MTDQQRLVRPISGPGPGAGDSEDPHASGGGVQRQLRAWVEIARNAARECENLSDVEQELLRRNQRTGQ